MKATRIDGHSVNGSRTVLAEVLPLDTPYSVTFFPIYACNFKCNYCLHSISNEMRRHISDVVSMDFELYKKCIDDIATFPRKLKALHFIGYGEPLLHKDISKMVAYAVEKEVADVVDIVTNGALLTPQLSNDLINAGLSILRISIQGINTEKYKQISGVDIDFEMFIKNIQYFYQQKKNTLLHVKIIDCMLDEAEESTFLNIFGNISDTIAVEHLVPLNEASYSNTNHSKDFNKNMLGNNLVYSDICPQPFYWMQINPDGKCIPCCNVDFPIYVGDCKQESVRAIWNNEKYNSFRRMHLLKKKANNSICEKCQYYKYTMYSEEVLDDDAGRLIKLFD
ncbi:radical SAM/SPASM domain-containing protein [Desulfosporosinus shakirovi]|uniref:radical SAM/SPASM domain-containing protein n=1 Tax=Desulfosporosinus shakirovi TaxID=2885154 RepID=UPI001E4BD4E3|nr:radical SAM protein [Desulfosporosinus sp. SRJS8]MCB8814155.1 radical SAM protein [Desulfosporosinus sp. SRJS8]